MNLQPNEYLILDAINGNFKLTNRRVSLYKKDWGFSSKIDLYLEDISSIRTVYTHSILLLGLTILCGLAAVTACFNETADYRTTSNATSAMSGLTILFLVWWFLSKRRFISIHPNGGKPLEFNLNGVSHDQVFEMLEKVQLAKTERIYEINKTDVATS